MSSVLDDPELYKKNPLYDHHEPSNYSSFYITLFICTILTIALLVFNVLLCCFSKHRHYWIDSNTGNRWLLPIWVKSPAGQPPLDLKELEKGLSVSVPLSIYELEESQASTRLELTKQRESEI